MSPRGEIQVRNFQCKGCRVEVRAIAEDDDGKAVGRETRDVGMEADGVAVVPHAGMTAIRVEEPAEAVGDGSAFGAVRIGGPLRLSGVVESRGSQGRLHFLFA